MGFSKNSSSLVLNICLGRGKVNDDTDKNVDNDDEGSERDVTG